MVLLPDDFQLSGSLGKQWYTACTINATGDRTMTISTFRVFQGKIAEDNVQSFVWDTNLTYFYS